MKKCSAVVVTLQYTLPPLNVAFIVWMVFMNHAFVHPTSLPIAYSLRSHGLWYFSIFNLILCVCAVVLGLLNAWVLYRTYQAKPLVYRRFKNALTYDCAPNARIYLGLLLFLLVFFATYAIVGSLAFRELFARKAYDHTCDGYALMAEVEVLSTFGFAGGNSSVFGASSRIRFFKDQQYVYTMDLIRDYRMGLGFNQYRPGTRERQSNADISSWGLLSLQLVTSVSTTWQDSTGTLFQGATEGYFNTSSSSSSSSSRNQTSAARNGTNTAAADGPVGGVVLDLRSSSYVATYTNTSRPSSSQTKGSFGVPTHNLTFPDLRLDQTHTSDSWRFTDHLCLPPRILLGAPDRDSSDVSGEMSRDCTKYRVCALKYSDADAVGGAWGNWWDWVENVWPIVMGVVAWEVEGYSACCIRKE